MLRDVRLAPWRLIKIQPWAAGVGLYKEEWGANSDKASEIPQQNNEWWWKQHSHEWRLGTMVKTIQKINTR